ncbi:peptidylprolyl isomerase [Arthrospiribacter ruber]|uniref:Peptidylprolyl isomerase n=1 Tax=Arthrospiribacter ruber TaxID=2487934 RepID=A0A951IXM4_9BACT|nr:peptidylprolyl isomerase [Arthrospiribacter ruber]MBW3467731.1 peptidylprolyl isomerase [Arthrospiribacter ruber]
MSNLKYLFVALIFASGISAVKAQEATSEEKPAATTPTPTSGQVLDKIVAKVNNYILLESDVQLAYLEAVAQSQQGFEAPTRCEVFESLLINKLMVAKADLDSITVTDAEVMFQADQRLSMVMQQFGGDENILAEVYGKTADQLKSEIEEQLKEQLIVQKMQQKITEGLTISPAEVRKFYNSIPRDSLPFFSAEVTVGQIVKKPEVSQHVKDDIIAKMREFRRQIDAGEADFQTLARNNSEDPGSAAQGGELGFFRRGELAPEYEATALSLRPGEISEPIETMFGFHMIQLLERRGNTFNTRHILIRPMPSEDDIKRAEKFLDSLRQQVIDKKIEFSKAAKEHSDDRPTSDNGGFFSDPQNQSNRLTLRTLEDPVLYFTLDSMKVGTITTPMRFEDEREGTKVRVLYYKERYPAHRANMDDDYEKLKAAARRKKEESILSTWFVGAKEDVFIDIDPSYDRCEVLKD